MNGRRNKKARPRLLATDNLNGHLQLGVGVEAGDGNLNRFALPGRYALPADNNGVYRLGQYSNTKTVHGARLLEEIVRVEPSMTSGQ